MNATTLQTTVTINDGAAWPCEVNIKQNTETVRSDTATKPDPAWEFTDENGHFHAFTAKGELPTLNRESVTMPCDGTCGGVCEGEGYTTYRYTCRICGQEVTPNWVPDYRARNDGVPIATPMDVTLTVYSDDGPLTDGTGDEVTLRVKEGDTEMIGIGSVGDADVRFRAGEQKWETTIYARSLEPRLSA